MGAGTALFVCGWCFSPRAGVRSLELLVDGRPQPLMAHGMPRSDVFKALHPDARPVCHRRPGLRPGSQRGSLAAQLSLGLLGDRARSRPANPVPTARSPCARRSTTAGEVSAELGPHRRHRPARRARGDRGARAGRRALWWRSAWRPTSRRWTCSGASSTRSAAQTHRNWVCVISDDCSSPRTPRGDRGGDRGRSPLRRYPARRGGCTSTATSSVRSPSPRPMRDYVAMADQDDFWHPDKLETLLAAIGGAQLAYSDARIVSPAGRGDRRHLLEPAPTEPRAACCRC